MGRGGQSKLHKDVEENKVLPFITNWGGRHRIHRCRHRSAEETRREAEDLERGRPEPLQPCVASRRARILGFIQRDREAAARSSGWTRIQPTAWSAGISPCKK